LDSIATDLLQPFRMGLPGRKFAIEGTLAVSLLKAAVPA
jgi:hypothetical protein